jgi:oligopeptide/dipeptide ABC transporter ATP-binding protein
MQPELLICDEVVSALDVSIQGQILNLLLDIREKRGLSFLFIAHDLRVACYFCDRIGVMYQGEMMEEAPAANLYRDARHPYTQLLFSSVSGREEKPDFASSSPADTRPPALTPALDNKSEAAPSRCPFAPRCVKADERCFAEHPHIEEISPGHKIRCFHES